MRLPSLRIIILTLMLASTAPLLAQKSDSTVRGKWSGSATVSGGYNYSKSPWKESVPSLQHQMADLKLNLKYVKNDFMANIQMGSAWDNHKKASEGISFFSEDISVKFGDIKLMSSRYNCRSSFQWKTPKTIYNSFALISYNYSHSKKDIFSYELLAENIALRGEDNNSYTISSGTGFNITRKLDRNRKVFFEVNLGYTNIDRYTEWAFLSSAEGAANRIYRKTPRSNGFKANSRAFFSAPNAFGIKNLDIESGGIFSISYDNDKYRGAYLKDVANYNSWHDSLKLRETFRYGVITLNPYLVASYNYKFLKLKADYQFQFFCDKLTNKEVHQSYDFKDPALIGNSEAEFRIAENHFVAVGYSTSIKRPTYFQLCWYVREGEYTNQYIMGNPNLKTARSFRNSLSYRIRLRKFSSEVSSSYTRNKKQLEQTFYETELDGVPIKVFTWVNSVFSKVWNTSCYARWDARRFYFRADLSYYDFKEKAKTSGKISKDHYWNGKISGGCKLERGWSFASDLSYRSKVTKALYHYDKYFSLNCKVQKDIGRHTIFLEGRDLLESKISTTFISLDEDKAWKETVYNNRRFFVLGYIFNF